MVGIIKLSDFLLDTEGDPIGSVKDCVMVESKPDVHGNRKVITDEKGNFVVIRQVVDTKDALTLGKVIVEALMLGTHYQSDDEKTKAYELASIILPWRRKETVLKTPIVEGSPQQEEKVTGHMPVSELPEPLESIVFIQKAIRARYSAPITAVQATKMLDKVLTLPGK